VPADAWVALRQQGGHVPSIDWNKRVWSEEHDWREAGDEWSGSAAHCGQPYAEWKRELVRTFITPYTEGARVLEVAPGHGRWTEHLLQRAKSVDLVEINASCLDRCRERFADHSNVSYHLTDGCSLEFLPDESIDFIWSFDSFVHMDSDVIQGYLREFARVLAPGGTGVIHHADKPDWSLRIEPLTRRAGKPGRVLQRVVSQRRLRDGGNRSNVSARMVARWAQLAGMRVSRQVDAWGDDGQYTVRRYHDRITQFGKPVMANA
jgi:ubiquinone/menaquinone biosynthesis C-methylase UbiE